MVNENKQKGFVQLCCFDNVHNFSLNTFSIKLQITLSIKKGLKNGFTHVPQLAPAEELFSKTMYKWKKLKFTKEERVKLLNGKTGTWWDLYEERFIKDTETRNDFKRAYKRLKEHLDTGKNIILICFCEDFYRCHRSIIGRLLEADGYKVIYK